MAGSAWPGPDVMELGKVYETVCYLIHHVFCENHSTQREHRDLCCSLGQCSLLPAFGLWWLGSFTPSANMRGQCRLHFLLFMHLRLTSADRTFAYEKTHKIQL